ncbi:hypothetical protein PFISCL1PPCAC_6835, partial [Pristionchus fissidentatus]
LVCGREPFHSVPFTPLAMRLFVLAFLLALCVTTSIADADLLMHRIDLRRRDIQAPTASLKPGFCEMCFKSCVLCNVLCKFCR